MGLLIGMAVGFAAALVFMAFVGWLCDIDEDEE